MNPHTQTPNNEAERLRDIAEIAMRLAKTSLNVHRLSIPKVNHSCEHQNATILFYETLNNLNKLVSLPEEPANPTCANTTHKFSHCDCNEPSQKDTSTETCPSQKDTKVSVKEPHVHGCVNPKEIVNEWREIGPDELICEGDEFQEKQYDPIKNKWYTIYECSMVGKKVSDSDWGRFRTRRPLPKPKLTRASYDEDWNLKLKQEEMPLDAEIASIEWSCAHTAKAIRYLLQQINTLRDEIQKLKQK